MNIQEYERTNHQLNPPIRPKAGLSNFMGNQEPPILPQEAHVTDLIPQKKRLIKIGINTYPLNPPHLWNHSPPITLVLVRLATNDVFIINNDQNITFLGHTGLLIIVWAPQPLSIVTIHYLKWGFKTWGVTSPPPYFGTILNAYTNRNQNSKIYSKSCKYSSLMASSCSQVASSGPQQVH